MSEQRPIFNARSACACKVVPLVNGGPVFNGRFGKHRSVCVGDFLSGLDVAGGEGQHTRATLYPDSAVIGVAAVVDEGEHAEAAGADLDRLRVPEKKNNNN